MMGIYNHKKHVQTEKYKRATAEKEKGAPVSRGWRTPYGFGDFTEPVTYEEACETMKQLHQQLFKKEK